VSQTTVEMFETIAKFKLNSLQIVHNLFIVLGILPFTFDFSHQRPYRSSLLLLYKHLMSLLVASLFFTDSAGAIMSLFDYRIHNSGPITMTSLEMTMNQLVLLMTNLSIFLNRKHIMVLFSNIRGLRPDIQKLSRRIVWWFSITFLIFSGHMIAGAFSFGPMIAHTRLQIAVFVLHYPTLHLFCMNTLFHAGCQVLTSLVEQLNSEITRKVLDFKFKYSMEKLMHRRTELSLQMSEFVDCWNVRSKQLNDLSNGLNKVFKTFLLMGLNVSYLVVVNQVNSKVVTPR
jgi:7tm Chemosensory receptor